MGYYVPERVIRLLCGSEALDKGRADYEAGRVRLNYRENDDRLDYSKYRAAVQGLESYDVALAVDSDGDVNAECTCPAYYHGGLFAGILRPACSPFSVWRKVARTMRLAARLMRNLTSCRRRLAFLHRAPHITLLLVQHIAVTVSW